MSSYGGMLLLAGAAIFETPASGRAQRHGGGHAGGAHFSGARAGGYHSGSYHGGYHYGHHPGFRYGYGTSSYPRYYGHRTWSYPRHYGYRYPRYYGSYGAWPYYYGYSYYPYSYDTYSYGSSSPAYDSGYYGSYGGVTSSYPDSYSPATAQPDTSVHVTVSVPADAEIWFEGSKMTSTGSVREYQSPPLAPGSRYTYEVRARWNEDGHEVTQTQQVAVTAGAHVDVRFPVQPTKAPTAPSH